MGTMLFYTATEPTEATAVTPSHHGFRSLLWAAGGVNLSGMAARLNEMGWTPEMIASALGGASMLVMALVSLLKAAQPYFDRIMDRMFPPKEKTE